MHSKQFDITIGDVPYRESLVAEIYYNNDQWVEISHENQPLIIQFYNPFNDKEYWEFPLDETLSVLESAKNKLLEL